MLKLTRAQRKMLLAAYDKQKAGGSLSLHGAWEFRCARHLADIQVVTLTGPNVRVTPLGESTVRAILNFNNPTVSYHVVYVHQAPWLSTKWTCTTKENINEAYPEDHKQTCGVWHFKIETARKHALKLNRKTHGKVHSQN
jgi:hypothetical protein